MKGILDLFRPTNLTYFSLAVIVLGIIVDKTFLVGYPGIFLMCFGIAILGFDFWCKYQIIKIINKELEPIDALKDKIIKEINDISTESQSGKLEDET